ncbi:MAG: dTDP-glucose 4,6-dehydratase [Atopobium sp.]|uniref:dTDP-glucose 4,6-dehydratase n=1 Tax=Atopobium sp. BS2 TaxID=936550 RepID=UPI00044E3C50|nr:dTDP-glucose 4,6-dehydratase [Atopobium sp. BS2]EWC94089.1 dTDP-glucose 4,6-dehydratase [Atopobium sp. BS2]MBF0953868.1 dTDP-glucose 4,6-dehydratase [Atopobium sp.]
MKTYLVTGGAGFIGSNFIHYMLRRNQDIHILNVDALTYAGNLENLSEYDQDSRYTFAHVDIRDKEALTQLFETYHPDYVVNFAAESHVDRSIEDPGAFADTNVMGTVALLGVAESFWNDGQGSYGDHRYLQVSTDEVYGSLPLDDPEAFFRETTPLSPHSPYSASKASADMFVKAWHDTYGFPAVITRCSNNYGPYQFPEKLIPLMIENCLEHKALPVYGDGLNVRDWLYVDDHCKAIAMVLEGGRLGEVYNVGGHNERNNLYIVKRIISEVARITGDTQITEDLISYVTDRKGHDRRYGIAPDKIKEELGWYPETPFEEGIVTTINWYLENREWVKNVVSGDYQDYYKKMYEGR